MTSRGPRGHGNRGRGDGALAPEQRGRIDGASAQDPGLGGRGDRGGGRGGRGGWRGGRGGGDRHGPPHGGFSSTKLGDDEHTPGPKIFRLVLRPYDAVLAKICHALVPQGETIHQTRRLRPRKIRL